MLQIQQKAGFVSKMQNFSNDYAKGHVALKMSGVKSTSSKATQMINTLNDKGFSHTSMQV